ncbi:hypothetical protein [Phenylobacterium sp.]|jgi:ribosomal protein L12E/L44/L45/RPP1/RPP2|uniref:hypothetical protein n=1 Tax=Phenylobacterium sp. TaxID=1871053 RepID=UPI002F944EC2
MADGELTLKLDDATARRLKEVADAVGVPVETLAADTLTQAFGDADVAEDLRRYAEYRRTGESLSVQEALQAFDAEIERRPAARP